MKRNPQPFALPPPRRAKKTDHHLLRKSNSTFMFKMSLRKTIFTNSTQEKESVANRKEYPLVDRVGPLEAESGVKFLSNASSVELNKPQGKPDSFNLEFNPKNLGPSYKIWRGEIKELYKRGNFDRTPDRVRKEKIAIIHKRKSKKNLKKNY